MSSKRPYGTIDYEKQYSTLINIKVYSYQKNVNSVYLSSICLFNEQSDICLIHTDEYISRHSKSKHFRSKMYCRPSVDVNWYFTRMDSVGKYTILKKLYNFQPVLNAAIEKSTRKIYICTFHTFTCHKVLYVILVHQCNVWWYIEQSDFCSFHPCRVH